MKNNLISIILLRCPYCIKRPLQSSWFEFQKGCDHCKYKYEREPGYYSGASQMILFPAISLLGIGGCLLAYRAGLTGLSVAFIGTGIMLFVGLLFFPYSQALWMVIEHHYNPLTESDYQKYLDDT